MNTSEIFKTPKRSLGLSPLPRSRQRSYSISPDKFFQTPNIHRTDSEKNSPEKLSFTPKANGSSFRRRVVKRGPTRINNYGEMKIIQLENKISGMPPPKNMETVTYKNNKILLSKRRQSKRSKTLSYLKFFKKSITRDSRISTRIDIRWKKKSKSFEKMKKEQKPFKALFKNK